MSQQFFVVNIPSTPDSFRQVYVHGTREGDFRYDDSELSMLMVGAPVTDLLMPYYGVLVLTDVAKQRIEAAFPKLDFVRLKSVRSLGWTKKEWLDSIELDLPEWLAREDVVNASLWLEELFRLGEGEQFTEPLWRVMTRPGGTVRVGPLDGERRYQLVDGTWNGEPLFTDSLGVILVATEEFRRSVEGLRCEDIAWQPVAIIPPEDD
jgi:hypothetical protein